MADQRCWSVTKVCADRMSGAKEDRPGLTRVVAGTEHTRHHGTKTGNAMGRPKRIFDRSEVVPLRDGGLSIEKIAAKWASASGPWPA
jgi:hypothetical protein